MQPSRVESSRPTAAMPALAAALTYAAAAWGNATDTMGQRTFMRITPRGTECIHETAPMTAANPLPRLAPRADELLWSRYLEWPIFTTTEINIPSGSLFTGTYLNDPKEAEFITLESDGTPTWIYPGTQFEVAAARNADVLAAVDFDGANITLYKWHAGSDVPDWSYVIKAASLGSYRPLAISPDGSIIAAWVTMQDVANFSRLYWFSPDSSTPLGTFDDSPGTFARNLSLSAHGEYVGLMSGAMVHVIDTSNGSVRYSISAGASNDAMAISGDGSYLAYGWLTLYVRQWNGSTYQFLFSRPGGGDYLRHCLFSPDSSALVTAWNPTTHLQNRIELHELPSSTPAWVYEYKYGGGTYQDVVDNMAMTNDGDLIAVASWGDMKDTNPEVHVFDRADGEPIYTFNTPGSMFDVDIARDDDGSVYVTACGKHVHANQQGHGGDLYAMKLVLAIPGDINGDGVVDTLDLLEVLSAWGDCPDPPAECPADLNGDGVVDVLDLLIVLGNWT